MVDDKAAGLRPKFRQMAGFFFQAGLDVRGVNFRIKSELAQPAAEEKSVIGNGVVPADAVGELVEDGAGHGEGERSS